MNPVTARPRPARALLALLTAFLLAFSGLIIGAAPASAAEGPSVAVTKAPAAGGAVTVTGTGFAATSPGIYVGIGATGAAGFYTAGITEANTQWVSVGAIMQADGSFSVTLTAPAPAAGGFSVYTSKAHGQGIGDKSQDVIVPVVYEAPVVATPKLTVTKAPAAGGAVTVTGTGFAATSPGIYVGIGATGAAGFYTAGITEANTQWVSVGAIMQADGSFSVTLTAPAPAAGGFSVYTSKAHGQGIGDKSQDVIVPVLYEALPTPKVTVSKTSGLAKGGETITVSGTGFSPAHSSVVGTRPPLLNQWSGAYVVFGSFKDAWKPSEGAPAGNRKVLNSQQRWLLPQATLDANSSIPAFVTQGAPIDANGSFSFELTVAESADALAGGNYGIYSYAAGGPTYAPFETYTPLSFGIPTPKVTVSKTSGLAKGGETITVSGTGFSPAHSSVVGTRPPLLNQWSGAYVVFGSFKDAWKPSEGAPAGNRKVLNSQQRWLLPQATLDANSSIPAFVTQGAPIDANGSFSFELTVAESADALAGGNYGIYSYAAGGPTYAPFETYTPLSFGTTAPPVVTPPTTPPAVVTPISSGSLTWGIKESFRSYVTSSIASGTITTSGARASGGSYVFGQAAGGSFTEASGVGTSNYSGAVRFTGHAGVLDVTIANPVVRVDSATSGTLFVTVNGSQIAMANLNLAAANRSVSNGAVTYSGAPAVLTSAGTGVFSLSGSPFYTVGTALDPVTFTIGAPSTASAGSAVVASFQRPATSTPAPTAPATTGVEIVEGEVAPGSTVTIRATGFQPNETGILVVLYSTPTVLDRNATADANGVVTWTGVLPNDFSGEHTLTFQGSVDRGVVVDFGSAAVAALASCVVDNATVTWGFKESFRAYISGSIAHGEWIVGEGLEYETPNFLWKTGTGTFDSDEMTGEIALPGTLTFTGHGGVLNTTLSNLRVQFDGDETAFLVFDISGDTQAGETIDERNVKFVELDLAAATTTDEDGEISFADVPAELTADGEATFGTYSAGEAFDPVTLTITEGDGCAAVAPTTEATEDEAITPISAQPDYSWLVWVLVALAIVAAVVITLVVRARRKKA